MSQHCHFDASMSLTALEQDSTIIAVIEMSQTKWLVAALVPGVERQPLKKFDAHEEMLLKLLHRWRREAGQAGRNIKRIVVAFEAGRDGFWLARWLRARDVEVYVIHPCRGCGSQEAGIANSSGKWRISFFVRPKVFLRPDRDSAERRAQLRSRLAGNVQDPQLHAASAVAQLGASLSGDIADPFHGADHNPHAVAQQA
jgi:hypothetical protein